MVTKNTEGEFKLITQHTETKGHQMPSLNKVMIIGHLGADPDVKALASGSSVCNLSVATSEKWKDKKSGEMQEKTEWHRVSMFGKLADVAADYLQKGDAVYIEGSLQTRKWQDNDGNDRYSTDIKAFRMLMLGGKRDGKTKAAEQQRPAGTSGYQDQQKPPVEDADSEDGFPF